MENGCGVRATYRSIVLGSVFVCDIISPTLLSFFFLSLTDTPIPGISRGFY